MSSLTLCSILGTVSAIMKQNIHISQQNIAERKASNVFKTWFYMLFFALLIGAISFILASYFNSFTVLATGFVMAIGVNIFGYWFSDKMVLKMAGAKEIEESDNPELFNMVRELTVKDGLPMPKVYMVQDASPNAFATGRNPEHSAICFTTGILALLNKEELRGVTAHELSHVKNRDTLLMTVVAMMASLIQFLGQSLYYVGAGQNSDGESNTNPIFAVLGMLALTFLAPMAASLVQMAISRKREFLADTSGAELAGSPFGLADALKKIHGFPVGMNNVNPSISHLFIENPEKETPTQSVPWYASLFMTHPTLEERLKNLLG